ncbi:MAG TPA: hypothetical protein VHX52_08260 [Steroidobacteraceae bacterium]|nr:hypothetical protein [Steroidobacteraceae bacterium]
MNSSATDSTCISRLRSPLWCTIAGAGAGVLLGAAAPTAMAQAPVAPSTAIQAGPVDLTFGGFTALEMVDRNRNEGADIGSDFNTGIPFPYQSIYHMSEFRESARQSRFSVKAQDALSGDVTAQAYLETDFLSAAVTSNSRESNSYTLRMRHFYGLVQNNATGWYLLAGQTWSLATLFSQGLTPHDEITPLTIDAQYVAGFNWTRNPQLRIVKSWGRVAALGLSFESPQAVISAGANAPGALVNQSGLGSGLENSTTTYSLDFAPDTIIKFALDPGYGHYEIYGMARGFRDRYPNNGAGTNDTTWGTSGGAGVVLPLVKQLTFQVTALAGDGIGRYGSAQLPDVTVRPDGSLATIGAVQTLAGFVLKPDPRWTAYLYGGLEKADRTAFTNAAGTTGYGYGSDLYNNSGCDDPTGTAATCVANTRSIQQVAAGFWWKYYQGEIGNLQFGLQGSYTRRNTFTGIGGDPSTDISMVFISFRYYPYQR